MSLEKAIEKLTEAINRHTEAILGGAYAPAEDPTPFKKAEQADPDEGKDLPTPEEKPQPTQAPESPKEKPAPKAEQAIDRHALGQRNLQLARQGKMTEMKALMAKFGISNFKDLPDEKLADWSHELDKLEA